MKRLTKILATLALVALGSAAPAAVAAPPPAPPGLPVYLALGDSIANGQNSAEPTNVDDYWAEVAVWNANGCVTPFRNYLATNLDCLPARDDHAAEGCKQLNIIRLARSAVPAMGADPALPGVTTASLITEQLPVAEKLLTARNRDANPRNDVEVVTLTVGGNELFDAVQSGEPEKIQQAIGTFIVNYAEILARLRAAAGPQTPIITMTYFNPLPYCGAPGDPAYLDAMGTYILEGMPIPPLGSGFNGVIRRLSANVGAVPADTFGLLGEGDFFDCKHPNSNGYAKITDAFETAWAEFTD